MLTSEPALGVRSWITLTPKLPGRGKEEALCLWLNSAPGLMLRIVHANRPYLGRSAVPHELLRTLPVLNVEALSASQRDAAISLAADLRHLALQGFSELATDPVRRELDRRLFAEVLGRDMSSAIDELALALNNEPTLNVRH